jgi:hypothetical protein
VVPWLPIADCSEGQSQTIYRGVLLDRESMCTSVEDTPKYQRRCKPDIGRGLSGASAPRHLMIISVRSVQNDIAGASGFQLRYPSRGRPQVAASRSEPADSTRSGHAHSLQCVRLHHTFELRPAGLAAVSTLCLHT